MDNIGIDLLLDEQKRSANHVVIRSVPGDGEQVRITPLMPGVKCACRGGQLIPRTAIKRITKTGKTLRCCKETLQIVEVEFSPEKLISYDELFTAVRLAHSAAAGSALRQIKRLVQRRRPHILEPFPVSPFNDDDGGGGGGDGEGEDDYDPDQCLADCMSELILYEMPDDLTPSAQLRYIVKAYNDCKRACP